MKRRVPQLDRPASRKRELTVQEIMLWQETMKSGGIPSTKHDPKPAQAEGKEPPKQSKPAAKKIAPQVMDGNTKSHISKGKTKIKARIDLHGMTVDAAHRALVHFLLRMQGEKSCVVLVITGKGKAPRVGILRAQLPHWLEVAPLKLCVGSFSPAALEHGGEGAWYIKLKKLQGGSHV